MIDRTTLEPSGADVTYWYTGDCPQTGKLLRLPRTRAIETIAQKLLQELAANGSTPVGKMYGVLLVATPTGEQQVLKACSGWLLSESTGDGWVPPIPGRDRVALAEAATLATLAALKQEILTWQLAARQPAQHYDAVAQNYANQLTALKLQHQQARRCRQQQRQDCPALLTGVALTTALKALDDQSRQEKGDRRRLNQAAAAALQPLQQKLDQIAQRLRDLKHQRQQQSQQLQAQLYASYRLTNFAGQSLPLAELMSDGTLPTGTGECCAPKLLHYAATHHLTPVAMAEFWWGPDGDRRSGEFYGACVERCQPLMGFLLSGLGPQPEPIAPLLLSAAPRACHLNFTTLYADDWLIVVDKPAGLLSVPGRSRATQDSVLTRLQQTKITLAVHRLDQDTSGILLCARDRDTHRQLQRQWPQIHKVYEAVLAGIVPIAAGSINLPLWPDPTDRPYQKVDRRGKPSLTQFRVLAHTSNSTRIEFVPHTGRTHQLRVHAAVGLGLPIVGDRLYGQAADRLHLHARELRITHPHTGQLLRFQATTPF